MKPITNYRECDAGAWLTAMTTMEHEPDVETIATPIPSPIRLPVTGFTKVPQVVSRESLVSVGRQAAEVDAVGSGESSSRREELEGQVVRSL